ncbi:hypothetical protein [Rubneribacter sp.]
MSGHDPTYRVEWRMTLDDPVSEKGGCVGYAGSELARALYAWEGLDPIEAFRTLRAQTGCASFGFAVVCEQDGLVKASSCWDADRDAARFSVRAVISDEDGESPSVLFAAHDAEEARRFFDGQDARALYLASPGCAHARVELVDASPCAFGFEAATMSVREYGEREYAASLASVRDAVREGVLDRDGIKRLLHASDAEVDDAEKVCGCLSGHMRIFAADVRGKSPAALQADAARVSKSHGRRTVTDRSVRR